MLDSCPELILKPWRSSFPNWAEIAVEQPFNNNPEVYLELTTENCENKRRYAGVKYSNKNNQEYLLFHGDRWGQERIVAFTYSYGCSLPIVHLASLKAWPDDPGYDLENNWQTRMMPLDKFVSSQEATQFYGEMYDETSEEKFEIIALDYEGCCFTPFMHKEIIDEEDSIFITMKNNEYEDCSAITESTPTSTAINNSTCIHPFTFEQVVQPALLGKAKKSQAPTRKSPRAAISQGPVIEEISEAPPGKRATALAAAAAISTIVSKPKPTPRQTAKRQPISRAKRNINTAAKRRQGKKSTANDSETENENYSENQHENLSGSSYDFLMMWFRFIQTRMNLERHLQCQKHRRLLPAQRL